MSGLFGFLGVAIPFLSKLLDLYLKAPTEKRPQVATRLLSLLDQIDIAVHEGKKTGNYTALEDILNRSHSDNVKG